MTPKSSLKILSLSLLIGLNAQAQSLPAPMREAARKAVRSNPEVQARWNGFMAAGSEREVARGGFLPQVDLTGTLGRENNVTPSQDYGGYNTTASRLTLTQMLFDGGFTSSETRRLGYAKLTRYYELAEIAETTALEAVRAYVDVVRYRELVEAATENYAEHKAASLLVEERAKSGVGRGADLEQANGRLALAESNLLTELTNLHDVSARYLRIVGEKPPASLPMLPDPFKLAPLPASADALLREGLQKSPTINAALENVRALNQAIETRSAAMKPRLDLRAFQSTGKNGGGTSGDTRTNGIELVLNINLYRGGSDSAGKRQAVSQKEQARDLQEKACRDTRQTLSIAYSDVRTQTEQMKYQDQHRLSTEKSREAYRQQFDIGQRSLLDLLDTQNEFFEANRAYINTRHTQAASQARVLAGMGQLVPTLGVQRSDIPSAAEAGQDRQGIDPAELCPPEESTVAAMAEILADVVLPARARPPLPLPPVKPAPGPATSPITSPVTSSVNSPALPLAAGPVAAGSAAASGPKTAAPAKLPLPNEAVTTPLTPAEAEVRGALEAWAAAWSRRDVAAYAAAYVPDHQGKAASPADWLQGRTARIAPRRRIDVQLSEITATVEGDRAQLGFRQHYQSDGLDIISRKRIEMEKIGGRWLIKRETER